MRALMLAIALLAGACNTLQTTEAQKTGDQYASDLAKPPKPGLVPYRLPRAYMTAELQAQVGDPAKGYKVVVYAPILQPDDRYALMLRTRLSPTADDNMAVKIDPQTGLLLSLNVISEDRTDDILPILAAAKGAESAVGKGNLYTESLTPGEAPKYVVLARVTFDPLEPGQVATARGELCKALEAYDRGACLGDGASLIAVTDPAGASMAAPADPDPAIVKYCKIGVCVPIVRPVLVKTSLPGGGIASSLVQVPDPDRLARIDFQRAVFVKRETQATFNYGMAATVATDKPSEVVGLVLIPINIVRAGLGAVSEVLQLRINVNAYSRKVDDKTTAPSSGAVTQVTLPVQTQLTLAAPPAMTGTGYTVPAQTALYEIASLPPEAWTTAKSAYVEAKTDADEAQSAYDEAKKANDAAKIQAALRTLRTKQAAANAAAAKARIALPFPSLAPSS